MVLLDYFKVGALLYDDTSWGKGLYLQNILGGNLVTYKCTFFLIFATYVILTPIHFVVWGDMLIVCSSGIMDECGQMFLHFVKTYI